MPYLDSIPLCWVKLSYSWCLFEVLHKCMIIDSSQDTVKTFSEINRLVSQEYRKNFDAAYKDLPLPSQSKDQKNIVTADMSTNYNLRASFLFSKLQSSSFNQINHAYENKLIRSLRSEYLGKALVLNSSNIHARINSALLSWENG